eukprot:TRINITY_DN5369_c0_g1_i1.p1 TRINITY_DN5369_c0_g1~~TRINITY_DN5369_c0_g1_i1.p1  ORF type:complete len:681 (-),score=216.93 TRINITY_DN5369_c0_g1_i1:443-2485(-)
MSKLKDVKDAELDALLAKLGADLEADTVAAEDDELPPEDDEDVKQDKEGEPEATQAIEEANLPTTPKVEPDAAPAAEEAPLPTTPKAVLPKEEQSDKGQASKKQGHTAGGKPDAAEEGWSEKWWDKKAWNGGDWADEEWGDDAWSEWPSDKAGAAKTKKPKNATEAPVDVKGEGGSVQESGPEAAVEGVSDANVVLPSTPKRVLADAEVTKPPAAKKAREASEPDTPDLKNGQDGNLGEDKEEPPVDAPQTEKRMPSTPEVAEPASAKKTKTDSPQPPEKQEESEIEDDDPPPQPKPCRPGKGAGSRILNDDTSDEEIPLSKGNAWRKAQGKSIGKGRPMTKKEREEQKALEAAKAAKEEEERREKEEREERAAKDMKDAKLSFKSDCDNLLAQRRAKFEKKGHQIGKVKRFSRGFGFLQGLNPPYEQYFFNMRMVKNNAHHMNYLDEELICAFRIEDTDETAGKRKTAADVHVLNDWNWGVQMIDEKEYHGVIRRLMDRGGLGFIGADNQPDRKFFDRDITNWYPTASLREGLKVTFNLETKGDLVMAINVKVIDADWLKGERGSSWSSSAWSGKDVATKKWDWEKAEADISDDENRLPPDWQKRRSSRTAAVYYYNTKTGVSQNERPAAAGAPATTQVPAATEATLPPNWQKMTSRSSGKVYYYNAQTGVSQNDPPTA